VEKAHQFCHRMPCAVGAIKIRLRRFNHYLFIISSPYE